MLNDRCHFKRLPLEVFALILGNLDLKSLRVASSVCSTWNSCVDECIGRNYELPLSALLSSFAPMSSVQEEEFQIQRLDTTCCKVDRTKWGRCRARTRLTRHLLVDCVLDSNSAVLLQRLLSAENETFLFPALLEIHFPASLLQPHTGYEAMYPLLSSPSLRSIKYHVSDTFGSNTSAILQQAKADRLFGILRASSSQIEDIHYDVSLTTDCEGLALFGSLRILRLRGGIKLATWGVIARQCPLLEEIHLDVVPFGPATETDTIITFPSVRSLDLMSSLDTYTPAMALQKSAMPALRVVSFTLIRQNAHAFSSILASLADRSPELQELRVVVGSAAIHGYYLLPRLQNLRVLEIRSHLRSSALISVAEAEAVVEGLPGLRELTLSYLTSSSDFELPFSFLRHVARHCPSMQMLALSLHLSNTDTAFVTDSEVVFNALTDLELRITGMSTSNLMPFVEALVTMCPGVKQPQFETKRVIQGENTNFPAAFQFNPDPGYTEGWRSPVTACSLFDMKLGALWRGHQEKASDVKAYMLQVLRGNGVKVLGEGD